MTTILTVDDSSSIRDVVSLTLSKEGFEVLSAEDGNDALAVVSSNSVDMVITDLNMPNKNGVELIKELRSMSSFAGVPIIMLTTESQEEKRMEGKAAGATGWLVKPFKPNQLADIVKKLTR